MQQQLNRSNRSRIAALLIVCAATLAGNHALAQEADKPLRGPEVKDNAVPGENRKFTGGGGKARGENTGRALPHRAFVKAFEVLKGDNVDADLRLSSAQEDSLKKIDAEMKDAQRKYLDDNKAEIQKLRDEGGPEIRRRLDAMLGNPQQGGRDGTRPGGGRPPKGEKPAGDKQQAMDSERPAPMGEGENNRPSEELRSKARALFEGAPKPEEYHAKMLAVLSDTQKPVVMQEVERLRKESAGRGPRPGEGEQIPERMRERLKNMTPEQREEAIKKFRERREEGKDKSPAQDQKDSMSDKDK